MQLGWVVLCGVIAVGCTHVADDTDYSLEFLGDWQCAGGAREIDCGQGVVHVDLASGPSALVRFDQGTITNLKLLVRSETLVTDSPGGPICELGFETHNDTAFLHAESVCTDAQGAAIAVEQGSANAGWRPDELIVRTAVTTSEMCTIRNTALCYAAK